MPKTVGFWAIFDVQVLAGLSSGHGIVGIPLLSRKHVANVIAIRLRSSYSIFLQSLAESLSRTAFQHGSPSKPSSLAKSFRAISPVEDEFETTLPNKRYIFLKFARFSWPNLIFSCRSSSWTNSSRWTRAFLGFPSVPIPLCLFAPLTCTLQLIDDF